MVISGLYGLYIYIYSWLAKLVQINPITMVKMVDISIVNGIITHFIWNISGWWFQPSEKYEFVSWDDYSQYIWKNKKCSKPQIRYRKPPQKEEKTKVYATYDQCSSWGLTN